MKKIFKVAQRIKKGVAYSPFGPEPEKEEEGEYVPDMPSPGEEMAKYPELARRVPEEPERFDPKARVETGEDIWAKEFNLTLSFKDIEVISKALYSYQEGMDEDESEKIQKVISTLSSQLR